MKNKTTNKKVFIAKSKNFPGLMAHGKIKKYASQRQVSISRNSGLAQDKHGNKEVLCLPQKGGV